MRGHGAPPSCNGVEMEINGQLVSQDWIDCNNANCPLSKANPNNQ